MADDDLLTAAAIPTTTARPDARIVLSGTPATAAGAFYDYATLGDHGSVHVHTFRWVPRILGGEADAHWISPTTIQVAREGMSEARFAAEYLAQFASGADSLFTPEDLRAVTADYATIPLNADAG